MKKRLLTIIMSTLLMISLSTVNVFAQASTNNESSVKSTVKIDQSGDLDNIIINQGSILTYEDFAAIKVSLEKESKKLTNSDIKKMIVKKINEKEKTSSLKVRHSYTIWGATLNSSELALVALHPGQAIYVYNDAQTALKTAQSLYKSSTLYQGNGDAFRHTYWNALMENNVGDYLAESFATAHEATSPNGIDKTMDLNNNATGRNIGWYYSPSTYKSTVINYVNNGWLNRIVNNNLTVTDSSGRL